MSNDFAVCVEQGAQLQRVLGNKNFVGPNTGVAISVALANMLCHETWVVKNAWCLVFLQRLLTHVIDSVGAFHAGIDELTEGGAIAPMRILKSNDNSCLLFGKNARNCG